MAEIIDLDRERKTRTLPRVRKKAKAGEWVELTLIFTPDFEIDDMPSDTEPDQSA